MDQLVVAHEKDPREAPKMIAYWVRKASSSYPKGCLCYEKKFLLTLTLEQFQVYLHYFRVEAEGSVMLKKMPTEVS